MNLPTFRYHPDPIATGSIVASDVVCVCCEQARGAIYVGPVYAKDDLDEKICPWCIADGSAAARFNARYVDEEGVDGYGRFSPISDAVRGEISWRTPGYAGWQQETWWTHCNDGAAFLGPVGREELDELGDEAWAAVRLATGFDDISWAVFVSRLNKNHDTTAYLFRCLHCGQLGATWDCM